jgi:hypothetical protein
LSISAHAISSESFHVSFTGERWPRSGADVKWGSLKCEECRPGDLTRRGGGSAAWGHAAYTRNQSFHSGEEPVTFDALP